MVAEKKDTQAKAGNEGEGKVEKKPTCFVIMPISDTAGYEPGHFSRVYEYLLKPSIELAGFEPVRADDEIKTDYIVTGIIKKVVESDIVLCDISTRNPNVMYELGIRHAFEKPVALIKDKLTDKIFDIQGLRYHEYSESLRIDTVKSDILKIKEIIQKTASSKNDDFNSVVSLAMIQPAQITHKKEIDRDTQILLNAIKDISENMPNRNSHAFFTNDQINKISGFKVGCVSVKIGDLEYSLGDTLYNTNDEEVGTIAEINPEKKSIVVYGIHGKNSTITFTELKKLFTAPF